MLSIPAPSLSPNLAARQVVPALTLLVVAATGLSASGAHASAGSARTLVGYPSGPTGATVSPVQVLVDMAKPGDHIKLHAGTYTGQITISQSGTAAAPITIEPYGDGPVTLTADFPAEPCGNTKPAMNRTIFAAGGVDYWTIQKMKIVNGIWISGSNFDTVAAWFHGRADAHDWQTRRSLPGRGIQDPVAAKGIYSALSNKLGVNVDPAEGWRILGNDM